MSNIFDTTKAEFISTGCDLLDAACGGGIPKSKITQLYGDSASGKSALAAEIVANYLESYKNGSVFWSDAENACDPNYLATLGIEPTLITFANDPEITATIPDAATTVEGFFELLTQVVFKKASTKSKSCLVIVDSLDALSDRQESDREIDAKSYAMTKQKKLSEILRRITVELGDLDVTIIFLSQVRANIGGMGEASLPSGGKAIGFYATLRIKLARLKRLHKTIKGVKRDYGQITKFTIKKTRYSPPHREVDATFLFSFGVCNLDTSLNFLDTTGDIPEKDLSKLGMKNTSVGKNNFIGRMRYRDTKEAEQAHAIVKKAALASWESIERSFKPKRSKYGNTES